MKAIYNTLFVNKPKTGYVFEEIYMWHDSGTINFDKWVQPGEHWENPDTKRRFHGLLNASGLLDKLITIKARQATKEEILRFHTEEYHDRIVRESEHSKGGDGGELARFGKGGYEIAALSAGGVIAATEAIIQGKIDNAYCLVRPPGHHAKSDLGMGFCIFNNVVIGAKHARQLGMNKIAIIDYDVHHGNGTQDAFWDDPNTLFISIHQDNNYPIGTGSMDEMGGDGAIGSTINIPLPPGSGSGAYRYAFERVIIPSLHRFQPDMIFVSSGFDASFSDPLGAQMLSSEDFAFFTRKLMDVANLFSKGRILFTHEGGYSKDYVPFCGLAVVETLAEEKTNVVDSYLDECKAKGYQNCQIHQAAVVDTVASLLDLPVEHKALEGLSLAETGLVKVMQSLLSAVKDPERREMIVISLLKDTTEELQRRNEQKLQSNSTKS